VALAALGGFLLLPLLGEPAAAQAAGMRFRLHKALHGLGVWVRDTERVLFDRDPRVLGAVAYLLCDIAVLWGCLRAVGVRPPLMALVVGYQVGYLANLAPVPGGIGILDGGLLAALVLYKLPAAQTAAAVILYHGIALWVPTLGGTLGFVSLRRLMAGDEGPAREPAPARLREHQSEIGKRAVAC
jgi:hypothetical protein